MIEEDWEDYPDFHETEPVLTGKLEEGEKYQCPFCHGIREFGKKCQNCKKKSAEKIKTEGSQYDICKCGHKRMNHGEKHIGHNTGKEFSVCMICLQDGKDCVRFEKEEKNEPGN